MPEPTFDGLTRYVAWFGQNSKPGVCMGCQLARPVRQGYNGGQPMSVTMCSSCEPKYLAWCRGRGES